MSGTQSSASNQAVTPGNWITQSINGMQYDVLLPANYDPSVKYPTMLYLHQLDMGDDPSGLVSEVNPWFNSTAFRTDYPAIVVMPLLDQTADPSGVTINFGGVSTADTAGQDNALAALQQVMSQYSVDTSRTYITGNSLGGIGTEDMNIKYNAYTGTEGKVFAAALSLAGSDYGQGYPNPNASVVAALKNVPFWAIHGGQDTTVPLAWDQNLYAAEQASGGDMIYTQDNSLGHDVWDTYFTKDGPGSPLGWLFSQSTNGPLSSPLPNGPSTPPPPPTVPPSANDTVVTGTSGAISDASGNQWTITSGGQVAVNGSADTSTSGVIELAYVNGTVWQENSSDLWWGKSAPAAAWSPGNGTAASPLPATAPMPPPAATPTASANDTVVTDTTATITDASGMQWTITSGGQVAVNGSADTSTASVIELAYVNGTIWQENSGDFWWGKSTPSAAWAPGMGTSVSPLPAAPPPGPIPLPPSTPAAPPSANDTVVTGSNAVITDASGNQWTITSGGQVAINGGADTSTASVIELAYVNGTIWQENSADFWWGKSQPAATWAPGMGTLVSPLPATPATPTPPPTMAPSANNMVVTGTNAAITDASGNQWTITSGGQVAVNGGADTSTASVIELAYVNGTIWQENSGDFWWGKSQRTAAWAPGTGTSVSPLPAATPDNAIGSGSDTIVLTMSEDADGPAGAPGRDAEFTLNVDGQQIGGLQTVTASHAASQTQTFTFAGNFAPGAHNLTITFANNSMTAGDKGAFNDGGDRNVYVNGLNYDGSAVSSTVTGIYQSPFYPPLSTSGFQPGNAVFTLNDTTPVPADAPSTPTTTPAPVSSGTGPDTLTLAMSEDPYQGDASFNVAVDGQQVGGTFTTTAVEWQGQTQQFTLGGSWGNGPHTVQVTFLNDLVGPADAAGAYDPVDRNLYVNAITYDGTAATGTPYGIYNNGSQSFSVPASKAPISRVTASANNTVVMAGSKSSITDAAGNKWTITGGGQVAVNGGADTTTAGVAELAYVNQQIWQENGSNLWWAKGSPLDTWAPGMGTTTSPLPALITIDPGATSATVNQSQVSIAATSGNHTLFLSGSNDSISMAGGSDIITDTGSGNTYVLPAAGHGAYTFTSNILGQNDTLDLTTALAATNWNGSAATSANYLAVTDTAQGATLSVAPTSGGHSVAIATIHGASTATLSSLLAHSKT